MPNLTAASPRANRARVPSVISIACVVLFVNACGEGTSPVAPRSLKPSLSIGTTPQTIEITSTPPAAGSSITSYAVQATATPSGLPVAFATEGPCSVAGNIVSLLERGFCTITATQPGDDTYAAATPVTQFFEIGAESCLGDINAEPNLPICRECVLHGYWGEFPCTLIELSQTLVFTTTPPASAHVGDTYQVGASSSLDLTPAFSSLTTAVCTVAGTTVTLVGAGTCIVAADQPGEYPDKLPAPQVTQDFPVSSLGPAELLTNLIAHAAGTAGMTAGTLAKLHDARNQLAAGKTLSACNKLREFIADVQNQRGKRIATSAANALIAGAQEIRLALGC